MRSNGTSNKQVLAKIQKALERAGFDAYPSNGSLFVREHDDGGYGGEVRIYVDTKEGRLPQVVIWDAAMPVTFPCRKDGSYNLDRIFDIVGGRLKKCAKVYGLLGRD